MSSVNEIRRTRTRPWREVDRRRHSVCISQRAGSATPQSGDFSMRKRLLALTGTVLWFGAGMGYAQDAPGVPRYEVGAQFISPYLREFSTVLGRRTELG